MDDYKNVNTDDNDVNTDDNDVQEIINLFNNKINEANQKIGAFKTDASNTLTTINRTIETINEKLEQLLKEIGNLEQTEKENKAEIDSLKTQVAALEKEKKALTSQIEKLQSELDNERKEITKLKSKIAENQEAITAAGDAKNEAQRILKDKIAAHEIALKDKINAKELEELKKQNQTIINEKTKLIDEKDNEIGLLKGETTELTEQLTNAAKDIKDLERDRDFFKSSEQTVEQQYTNTLNKLRPFKEANQKLTEELTKAREGLDEIKKAINHNSVDVDWKELLKQIETILTNVQKTDGLVDKLTLEKSGMVMRRANEINSRTKNPVKDAKKIKSSIQNSKGEGSSGDLITGKPTKNEQQRNYDSTSTSNESNLKKKDAVRKISVTPSSNQRLGMTRAAYGIQQNRKINLEENKKDLTKLNNESLEESIETVNNIMDRSDQSINGNDELNPTKIDSNEDQPKTGGKRRKSKGKTRKVRKHATKKKRKPLVGGKKRKQTRKRRSRKAKKANKKK